MRQDCQSAKLLVSPPRSFVNRVAHLSAGSNRVRPHKRGGRSIRLSPPEAKSATLNIAKSASIPDKSLRTLLFVSDECEPFGREAAQEPTRDGRQVTG